MNNNRTSLSRRSFLSGIAGFAAVGALATAFPREAQAVTAAEKQAEADAAKDEDRLPY